MIASGQKRVWEHRNLAESLLKGNLVVMPTDTLYGIVGRAEDQNTVERIYAARKRNPAKPCIILISDMGELAKFGIVTAPAQSKVISTFTEPTSFILDCRDSKWEYLHRGTKTLAFRIPQVEELRKLLKKTGPLIAPSANTEGMPPAKNITEAKKYFGSLVDFYADGGEITGKASKVVRLREDGKVEIIRE